MSKRSAVQIVIITNLENCFHAGKLRCIQLSSIQLFHGCGIVKGIVPAAVTGLDMKISSIVNQKQSLLLVAVRPQHLHFRHCRSQFLYRFLYQRMITVIVNGLNRIQINRMPGQNWKRSFIVASVFQLKTNALDPVHSLCRDLMINADRFLQRQVIVVFSKVWKLHALCHIVAKGVLFTDCFSGRDKGILLNFFRRKFFRVFHITKCLYLSILVVFQLWCEMHLAALLEGINTRISRCLCDVISKGLGLFLYFRGGSSHFFLGVQINPTLFADFLVVALNVRDKLTRCLIDNFQTVSQFLQFLALTPAGNIAKAVFSGLNAKILTNRIGNAFSLHFLCAAVFLLLLQKLGEGRKAASKIQPFFLGQHQVSGLRQFQRLCQQNGTRMVYQHLFFYADRLSGVIVRASQIIAINALRQIITDNPSIREQTGFLKQLDLLILLVIGNLDLFPVMELAVGNLVNRCRNRLHLAHAKSNRNSWIINIKITIRIIRHCFYGNRYRRTAAQGFHKYIIVLHRTRKG